ncbi:MAG: aminodeoxychorismate synthase component I [Pseudomonadales bacterium]|nr:aminodeoxychorismate synthase component I [Pseudomonadales bacterium]
MTTVEKIDIPYVSDSADIFSVISDNKWPIWLDSGWLSEDRNFAGHHTDILTSDPIALAIYDPHNTCVEQAEQHLKLSECFAQLEHFLRTYKHHQQHGPGWLGYLSYDLFNEFERIEKKTKAEHIPELILGFYTYTIVTNHRDKTTSIYYLGGDAITKSRIQDLSIALNALPTKTPDKPTPESHQFQLISQFQNSQSIANYRKQFAQVINYIHQGDCYQVNLTQEFSAHCKGESLMAFEKLRESHPSPMSAFFKASEFEILSISPERFVRKTGMDISSFPIKGTRPRKTSSNEDAIQIQELKNSLKDRAENLMIVDLLRNDFGRICEIGSVKADMLFAVESFPNVHHLVSSIHGKLLPGINLLDLFRATFPGGSITGAPKVRAMQIIEELEPHRRSIYCGSVVFLCANGDMDSNIGIRTLLRKNDTIRCWGGGGIVADSNCDNEYQETMDKVGKIMALLQEHFGIQKY